MPSFTDRTQKGTRSERTVRSFFACRRALLTPAVGSWAGHKHAQATHHSHRSSSRSHAAGNSHLLGQGELLAGVPSPCIKCWLSLGVTYGMCAQLNCSCLTPHPPITPALAGCLSFSSCTGTHYTHPLCWRWYQTARRQALLTHPAHSYPWRCECRCHIPSQGGVEQVNVTYCFLTSPQFSIT